MYTIALTGGIASGKTAVSRCFEALGIEVIDADVVARDVVAKGSMGLAQIVEVFGPDLLDADGELDRRAMRERVFAMPEARAQLEAIVHPLVRQAMRDGVTAAKSAYVVLAIPLFVESGQYGWVDRVLVIDVSRDTQIKRLTARDEISEELAESMLKAQATREQRLAVADDVIDNNGDIALLDDAVRRLHERYLQFARTKSLS
jgi:dephospho-CoA kinase